MDSARANKRRKLDSPSNGTQNSTPGAREGKKQATYSSKKPGFQIRGSPRTEAPTADGTTPKKSAHQMWEEAKARSLAARKKPRVSEKDVYDDIDGAHASPQKKAASTSKRKARLDPLRNQSASSPVNKTPVKSAATLGFFKQFHAPKVDSARSTPGAEGDGKVDEATLSSESDAELRAAEEQDDISGRDNSPSKPAGRIRTFEDEIREVEEAARQEVANEDGEGTPNMHSARRRNVGRRQASMAKPKAETARPGPQRRPVSKPRKPAEQGSVDRAYHVDARLDLDMEASHAMDVDESEHELSRSKSTVRRKAHRADHIDAQATQEADLEDAMELDRSEIEAPTPSRAVPAPKVKATKAPATPSKRDSQHAPKAGLSTRQRNFEPGELDAVQQVLLEKLTGKRPIPFTNLADEYAKVSALVTQTVTAGESNSMLVIGARGSGKTALANQVLCEQAVEHAHDFLVVRLNGFIHTDDKIALREIWRQLGREMELEEEEGPARNYADTLTTLLALLSHPAEQGLEQPDQVTKSVIFILDEFELFTSHPRQTLLYNLFEIAQSRKAPIAVLGLTTRVDVSESLEKRVKSRFSHRYVHLSLAKSFASFRQTCKGVLSVQANELSVENQDRHQTVCKAWNDLIESLLSTDIFTNHMRRIYYTTKSVPEFRSSMLVPLATLPTHSPISTNDVIEHFNTTLSSSGLSPPDSKLPHLSALSTLQLALLICAARLTNIHNTEIISFALAYEEYKVLASKARLQASAHGSLAHGAGARISGKDVAKDAWEGLVECGLVMYDGGSGRGGGGGGGRVDVGLEEIRMSGVDCGQWGRWCREI